MPNQGERLPAGAAYQVGLEILLLAFLSLTKMVAAYRPPVAVLARVAGFSWFGGIVSIHGAAPPCRLNPGSRSVSGS